MKNSGVEWIGKIPENWEVKKLKYICDPLASGGTPDSNNDQYYCENGTNWVAINDMSLVDYVENTTKHITNLAINEKKLKIYPKGTIIYSIYATLGHVAELSKPACINQALLALSIKDKSFNKSYFKYSLNAMKEYVLAFSSGNTQFNLNAQKVRNFTLLTPSFETQQHISSYLDKKCSKIEETIQNQQQVIEKLKAYKQSLITEAVTGKIKIQNGKACGKYESYKDSGVEWIGKIPKGWSCVQIKNIFRFLGGYAFNSEDYVDETEYQILRIGNVKDFKILFDSSPAYISKETALKVENFKLKAGYILFTMTGTRGKKDYFYTHKVTDADCTKKNIYLNQRVGCLIPSSNISSSYFNYLLKDNLIKDSVFLSETGTANQANIGSDDVMRIKLHCPPKEEQKEIADYLDKKCTAIDTAIEQKQELIEKLTEYKKSLIYECVTGKKEI